MKDTRAHRTLLRPCPVLPRNGQALAAIIGLLILPGLVSQGCRSQVPAAETAPGKGSATDNPGRSDSAKAFVPGENRVTFESKGEVIVGTLFLPADFESKSPLAAVVIEGPWTQVKEQVGYQYAQRLADLGLAALAIDHRYWGESGGEPRHLESTSAKVEDLQAAVSFLSALPIVDADSIGLLGVCAGAGNVSLTAAQDDRVSAMATVAAWLQHPSTTPLFYGGEEGVSARIKLAEEAKKQYETTREMPYVAAYDPAEGSGAAMFFPSDYYGSPERGRIGPWENEFAVAGWQEWLELNAIDGVAERIDVPVMMVHSDGSALPDNVKRFYEQLPGKKKLVWTEGEHTQFYDQDEQVEFASKTVGTFFLEELSGAE